MRFFTSSTAAALVFASAPLLAKASIVPRQACDTYVVAGVTGGFTTRQFIDFSNAQAGDDTAAFLSANGLYPSDWPVDEPNFISRTFTPDNVQLGNGALNMKVTAYSGSGNIFSSEISTTDVFKYASVRTVLKSSSTPGVCEGNFFYVDDTHEIDFEILTSTTTSQSACVPAGIWATNQPSSNLIFPFAFNPANDFHEYRIDWSQSSSRFYIDGQFKGEITQNVPQIEGPWMWNSWSKGDPCWAEGPPTADSITQIRSIEIFKGFVAQPTGTICQV